MSRHMQYSVLMVMPMVDTINEAISKETMDFFRIILNFSSCKDKGVISQNHLCKNQTFADGNEDEG